MKIRPAHREDGPAVNRLVGHIHAVRVPEDLDPSQGWLMNRHAPETYAKRFAASPLSFVAEDDEARNAIAGFLMAYPVHQAPWIQPGSTYDWIRSQAGPDAVLLDQIGVLPEYRSKAIAIALYKAFAAIVGPVTIWLDIVHAPVRNSQSISFFQDRLGFIFVREFETPRATYGIYRRDPP